MGKIKRNIIKFIKQIFLGATFFISLVILTYIVFALVNKMFFIESTFIFNAIGYFPVFWLAFPVLICSIIFFLFKKFKFSIFLVSSFFTAYIFIGDYSFKLSNSNSIIASGRSFSVITFNVKYFSEGIEKVSAFINNFDADILLLNEFVLRDYDSTKIHSLFNSGKLIFSEKCDAAIVSKYPIINFNEVEFPTHQTSLSGSNIIQDLYRNPKRTFLHAKILINNEVVNFISVRFIAGRPKDKSFQEQIKWGVYLMQQQIKEVETLTDYIKKIGGKIILGGDLNASPNSYPIRKLSKLLNDAALEQTGFPKATFTSKKPLIRLDYIFASKNIFVLNYERINQTVSDHYPIRANLILK